jgi:hypothetical protein
MFNLIDIYICITVNGCVCSVTVYCFVRGSLMLLSVCSVPVYCFVRGSLMLLRRSCIYAYKLYGYYGHWNLKSIIIPPLMLDQHNVSSISTPLVYIYILYYIGVIPLIFILVSLIIVLMELKISECVEWKYVNYMKNIFQSIGLDHYYYGNFNTNIFLGNWK